MAVADTVIKTLTSSAYQLMGAGPVAVFQREAGEVMYHMGTTLPAVGTDLFSRHPDGLALNYNGTRNVYARVEGADCKVTVDQT